MKEEEKKLRKAKLAIMWDLQEKKKKKKKKKMKFCTQEKNELSKESKEDFFVHKSRGIILVSFSNPSNT
jgi:hypothetical protein